MKTRVEDGSLMQIHRNTRKKEKEKAVSYFLEKLQTISLSLCDFIFLSFFLHVCVCVCVCVCIITGFSIV